MNRFYIERSLPYPLPSLATLLLAFGPPPHNTQYLGIGLFLLRSALWEQLFLGHTWLSLLHPPYLWLQAAGLAPAVLAEIASSVPIPPNIDIVVRLLLLLLVTSKNEIKLLIKGQDY